MERMREYGGGGRGGRPFLPWSRWSIIAAVLALPGAALVVLRVVPWDIGSPWIQLLSLFPAALLMTTAALAAAVVAVWLHAGTRRAVFAALVAALLVAQLGLVVDRVLPAPAALAHAQSLGVQPANDQPATVQPASVESAAQATHTARGRVLTVMAVNVGFTGIEPVSLVSEVRNRNVDILALPELAPLGLKELDKAGLASLLPFRATDVEWVGTGSALFSRLPLKQVERVPGSAFYQSRAVAEAPTATGQVHLTAVHIDSPRRGHIPSWRAELRQLGELWQALPDDDRHTILLGDFNASADHREFRELLATGLSDAADAAGKGLTPTWPVNSPAPAFVAIDHVLVSPGIEVADFQVVTLPGTDHAAIVARLVLP
jgi:endonuclease/exonuclease/phosphatase family metal-dependent hydrolase